MVLDSSLTLFAESIKDSTKHAVIPIAQHIIYAFKSDNIVEKLREQTERLVTKISRLQISVNEAERNGENIHENVTNWLYSAQTEIMKAELLFQRREAAKNCCFGLCPNLMTRHQLSMKAGKEMGAIEELLNETELYPVSFRPLLRQIFEPSVYSCESLPSRVLLLNQVIDALMDPNLNMIGVYGMGGIGKTTLAKEVHRKAVEWKSFDYVVMVAVSRTPDLRRIQGEIAEFLGLQLDVESLTARAILLHRTLKKSKVLIILDDIWAKLDLRSVGIPFGDGDEGAKILLTSRSKNVLCREMGTQKDFLLEVLPEGEAWRLFETNVAEAENAKFQAIATEVANKCAGLPLLILMVASDLRNKELYEWNDMVNRLSEFRNDEIYERVYSVLKLSYENLIGNQLKSFFLLCALYGRTNNIQIRDLVRYSMGLGLLKDMRTIEDARNRVFRWISKLKDESLLLDGDTVGYVKMHDVVRETALLIACGDQNAFIGRRDVRLREWPGKDCTRISLPYCDIRDLPQGLECPEADLFLLFTDDFSLKIPDLFFEGIRKLKVLGFTGIQFARQLPSSLGFLTNLQTLCLEGCQLDDVAMIGELKQLECLSFARSNIVELPREIEQLSQLKLLDLSKCSRLKIIPINVLSQLSLLEELYMGDSNVGWDGEGKASVMELDELCHLTTLEIQVNDTKKIPKRLFSKGLLIRYKIFIGNAWDWGGTDEASKTLKLRLKAVIHMEDWLKELLRGTQALYLDEVKEIENLLYDIDGEGCQQLKHLHIGNDDVIRHIIKSTKWASCCVFPVLETLSLNNLNSLDEICHDQLATGSFSKLQILNISGCHKLKNLLPYSFAKCLPQLQEMEVEDCDNMEAIIDEGSEDEVMEFTQLSSLKLAHLPRLKSIFSEKVSCSNLTNLYVSSCQSLEYLFKISILKSLLKLKRLEILYCECMEEIILTEEIEEEILTEEIEEEESKIVFLNLDFLRLIRLPNLVRFSNGYPIEFQLLREMVISACDVLKNFVSHISYGDNIQSLFNDTVTFSNLQKMKIDRMENLEYIWHNQLAVDSFCKLKSLRISSCPKLLAVFSSNVIRRFQRLHDLKVYDCDKIEGIYDLGELNSNEVEAFELRYLEIKYMSSLKRIWSEDPNGLFNFQNLTSVEVYECGAMEYVFPASIACGLLQLKKLDIYNCGVKHIVGKGKSVEGEPLKFDFSELTFLRLHDLWAIKSFNEGTHICEWPKLTYLEVLGSNEAVKLGPKISDTQGHLIIPTLQPLHLHDQIVMSSLEELRIEWGFIKHILCGKYGYDFLRKLKVIEIVLPSNSFPTMEKLVLSDSSVEKIIIHKLNISNDNHPASLPCFRKIILSELPNLEYLAHVNSSQRFFENLQVLQVWECNKLRTLVPSLVSFKNLKFLQVSNCDGLTYLITALVAKSLVQLKTLYIGRCKWLESIIVVESDIKDNKVGFSQIEYLVLDNLPYLTSFCSKNNIFFDFPCLEEVFVIKCPKMKIFAPVLNAPKLSQVQTGRKEYEWEGSLNNTIETLFIKGDEVMACYNAASQNQSEGASSKTIDLSKIYSDIDGPSKNKRSYGLEGRPSATAISSLSTSASIYYEQLRDELYEEVRVAVRDELRETMREEMMQREEEMKRQRQEEMQLIRQRHEQMVQELRNKQEEMEAMIQMLLRGVAPVVPPIDSHPTNDDNDAKDFD